MVQIHNTTVLKAGFVMILVGMTGLGALFLFHLKVTLRYDEVNDDLREKNFAVYQMRDVAEQHTFGLLRIIAADATFDQAAFRNSMRLHVAKFRNAQRQVEQVRLSATERSALKRVLEMKHMRALDAEVISNSAGAVPTGGPASDLTSDLTSDLARVPAVGEITRVLLAHERVDQALDEFVAIVEAETGRQRQALEQQRARDNRVMSVLGLFLFGLSAVIGVVVVRREVASTRKLEQRVAERTHQLGERDTHYRTIVETVADGIITTDTDGKIESLNPACERIFGYRSTDIVGQNITALIPAYDAYRQADLGDAPPLMATGGREGGGRRKDGPSFPIWLAFNQMQTDGKTKIVGVISDISAQKQAEGEARLLAEDTETVAAILRLSLTSDNLDHILQTALELVLGRQNMDLLGSGSVFLTDPVQNKLMMRAQANLSQSLLVMCDQVGLGQCLCGQAALSMREVEKSCLDDDHDRRTDDMTEHGHFCVPINYANDNLGVINLYTPHGHRVTDHERRLVWSVADALAGVVHRHYKEVELRQEKERAEAADRTKTEFLANISHELRTPLNAIIGYSEMMEKETFGPVGSERYRDYLKYISKSGHHLSNLINDLLDVSRIETDGFALDERLFGVANLILRCVAATRTYAEDEGIAVSFSDTAQLPSLIADPRRIEQVVLSLMNNAIKFSKRGGAIEVHVEGLPHENLCIVVADDGIGIAASDLVTVFDMFDQVDTSLARKYDGAGLGLPLSQKLMHKHGGQLVLESVPGQGTRAIITFPAARVKWC